MKHLFSLCALMCITAVFAQQNGAPANPPYTTPPTFPENQGRSTPPDTQAAPTQESSTAKVAMDIEEGLKNEPSLANSNVKSKPMIVRSCWVARSIAMLNTISPSASRNRTQANAML